MEKKNKFAFSLALNALSYLRMILVICSIVAFTERDYIALVLTIIGFAISTHFIDRVLDYPSNETIQELANAVREIDNG